MATERAGLAITANWQRFVHWREAAVLTLLGLLLVTTGADLWRVWVGDPSLGHAPLVPAIVVYLLWNRRDALRDWSAAAPGGAALLGLSCLLYAGAYWADVEFLKPLSAIGVTFGLCWFLGGRDRLWSAAGALGFLLFTIPWPTTLIGRLQFPLQVTSSSYAATFAGILGIPVQREGVTLSIVPNPARPPSFVILVAQQCSGLTSLIVLLALGYLIAYHTPVGWAKRALLFLVMIPVALLANALRLTFILIAGARHGAGLAQWVHDHEQPVLILCCTIAMLGVRVLLMRSFQRKPAAPTEPNHGTEEAIVAPARLRPSRLLPVRYTLAIAFLAFALVASAYARRPETNETGYHDFLSSLPLPYHGWHQEILPLTAGEAQMLQPDAQLMRRYRSTGGETVEIAVIAGHRKKTVHTPDYCLVGGGWETISQRDVTLQVAGRRVPAVRALLTRHGDLMLATYFFTDGEYSSRGLPQFQVRQIMRRLTGRSALGAMVRILVSAQGKGERAEERSDDFARSELPAIFDALASAGK